MCYGYGMEINPASTTPSRHPHTTITSNGVLLGAAAGVRVARTSLGHLIIEVAITDGADHYPELDTALFAGLVQLARAYGASINDDEACSCAVQGLIENLELY